MTNDAGAPPLMPTLDTGPGGGARCAIALDPSGDEPLRLLLPVGSVAQLVRNVRASVMPNTPPWFCGLLNRQGNLVPLFDLLRYFDLAPRARHAHALVVGDGDAAFALPVAVEPRIQPPGMDCEDSRGAPSALDGFVGAAYRHDGQRWYDFRFDAWLARLAAGAASAPHVTPASVEKPA